jgi:hypothetical protein
MKSLTNTKSELPSGLSFWQKLKSIHSLIQKFTTMKKLIFLIIFLAFIAGANQIYAQCTNGTPPRTLNCDITNPLTPIAGVPYVYSANVTPEGGTAYWYATESTTFMTGGAISATQEPIGGPDVFDATNYMTNLTNVTNPTTTTITWDAQGIADNTVPATDPPKLFVVVNYDNVAPACANNMKVYPIRPFNAFTVDITNIEDGTLTPLAYDAPEDQCAAGVVSAQWIANPAPDGSIDYDFGIDVLYFEVIGANFSDYYTPTFQLSGLIGDQTADVQWGCQIGTYDHDVVLAAPAPGGTWTAGGNVVSGLPSTSLGISIYVRVTVYNNDTEALASIPITLAVDAVNAANAPDVAHTDCLPNGFADIALQTINPRPTVTPNSGNFLPVAP